MTSTPPMAQAAAVVERREWRVPEGVAAVLPHGWIEQLGVRLAQKMQVGPRIQDMGIQLQKAEVGPFDFSGQLGVFLTWPAAAADARLTASATSAASTSARAVAATVRSSS